MAWLASGRPGIELALSDCVADGERYHCLTATLQYDAFDDVKFQFAAEMTA